VVYFRVMANPLLGLRDNQVLTKFPCQSHAQTPKWKSTMYLFFRHIVVHLSAIGGPTSSQAATDAILFVVYYPITSK
jgi:hypothetical protein